MAEKQEVLENNFELRKSWEEMYKLYATKEGYKDKALQRLKDYNIYTMNKNCIIFDKSIVPPEIGVNIHKNVSFNKCISTFNKCLEWLNGNNCKTELINRFCEFVNVYSDKAITVEEVIHNKWYENLNVQSAIIDIPEDYGKMVFTIICVDNWHILYVEMEENKIKSIDDEYVDPENGIGYNGVWEK